MGSKSAIREAVCDICDAQIKICVDYFGNNLQHMHICLNCIVDGELLIQKTHKLRYWVESAFNNTTINLVDHKEGRILISIHNIKEEFSNLKEVCDKLNTLEDLNGK